MPIKKDLKKVIILGSGPIVIGQACEFDYSGTQACKALMEQGLEVILINSNPATIMTDPEMATRVYIEPLKVEFIERVLKEERPSAIIPTLGGQTALNLALELDKKKVLKKLGIRLLGASPEVIRKAENREEFRQLLKEVGASYPESVLVKTFKQGMKVAEEITFPLVLRPNYTLGGAGSGVANSMEEYERKLIAALKESPTSEVLVEKSLLGWKEFELEVMRDRAGTFVVVCSVENIDPCGVHTGDSCSVSPQQTLSDKEYQGMRDEAQKIISAVGVETGGANIQFAVHPKTRERLVIEMNPRVSRSSALASKATGFPIAKIASLVAVGLTMDEIKNDITGTTPSCYEPALDYVVVKIPRFDFEKFEGSKDILNTQMKSVGEVMGMGRTFLESFMKALMSLEKNKNLLKQMTFSEKQLAYPNSQRMYALLQAFREGQTIQKIHEWTQIDPWFLDQFQRLIKFEQKIKTTTKKHLTPHVLLLAKRMGVPDFLLAHWFNKKERDIRKLRWKYHIVPSFYQVDTCAGEFASQTPYYYSTYWGPVRERKKTKKDKNKVVILGSGPNRIGQGIEFDYSCVRSVKRLKKMGYQTIMINSNPETVSTDYDTSDQLFFEPLTVEHTTEILNFVKPMGFFAQMGGQTPIGLASSLVREGFDLIGSSIKSIDLAEDRVRFASLCSQLGFKIPKASQATRIEEAHKAVKVTGYPVICRPSYVLGGRRMEIIENEEELKKYFHRYQPFISPHQPCLMDQFLENYLEVDVDLVCGTDWIVIGGIIEHIESAGVHSGDSMGVVPPQRLKREVCEKIEKLSASLARHLKILGFLNLQLAIKDDEIYILEANPRSSRSVPFLSKATGVPLVDLAMLAMMAWPSEKVQPDKYDWKKQKMVSVKGVVFPFKKFEDVDSILGPEMKSIGEVMGRGTNYSEAILKSLHSSQLNLPKSGEVFLSLRDKDKEALLPIAKQLLEMGYTLSATGGTAQFLKSKKVECLRVRKVHEGRPHCVDRIRSGQVAFVINTTSGRRSIDISFSIRRSCLDYGVPCITESEAAKAVVFALHKTKKKSFSIQPLTKYDL
ncbi:MAG: carbamoyl-phosphate synthase large subunit [Oligoflexia bacterium]|nr:carbamoyl-phosphate synthase large subunit [Oligoflexia bacterium]